MSFSVVYHTGSGRILRQGNILPDHPLLDGEAVRHFGEWVNTTGKAIDPETHELVEATPSNSAISGLSLAVMREERTRRLAETDYLMTIDYPISEEKRERFKVYRQALRDMPTRAVAGEEFVWPVFPSFD